MRTKWFQYWFEDGTTIICGKLTRVEIQIKEKEYGKLLRKNDFYM